MCYNETMNWDDVTCRERKKKNKIRYREALARKNAEKEILRNDRKDRKYAAWFGKLHPGLCNRGTRVIFYADEARPVLVREFDSDRYNTAEDICLWVIRLCREEAKPLRCANPGLRILLYINGSYHDLSDDGRIDRPEDIDPCIWHEPVGDLPQRDESYPEWLERSVVRDGQRFYVKSDYVNVNQYRLRIKIVQEFGKKIRCYPVAERIAVKTVRREDPTEVPENIQKLEQKDYSAEVEKGWRSLIGNNYRRYSGVTDSGSVKRLMEEKRKIVGWVDKPFYEQLPSYTPQKKYGATYWDNDCFLFEGPQYPVEDGDRGPSPVVPKQILDYVRLNEEAFNQLLDERIRRAEWVKKQFGREVSAQELYLDENIAYS